MVINMSLLHMQAGPGWQFINFVCSHRSSEDDGAHCDRTFGVDAA